MSSEIYVSGTGHPNRYSMKVTLSLLFTSILHFVVIMQTFIKQSPNFRNSKSPLIRSSAKHSKSRSRSKRRRSQRRSTMIEPYKTCKLDLNEYERENGKINVSELSRTGVWKQLPDLIRNELWIRAKERNRRKLRRRSRRSEMKECTFKPHINKRATLSPSPKYKYHDLQKNRTSSYSKQGKAKLSQKHRDNHELYGKYIQSIGTSSKFPSVFSKSLKNALSPLPNLVYRF